MTSLKTYTTREAISAARRAGWAMRPCNNGTAWLISAPSGRRYRLRISSGSEAPLGLARELTQVDTAVAIKPDNGKHTNR